jgi:predicted deacylase
MLMTQVIMPVSTATLMPDTTFVGLTVEGRPILARDFGSGDKRLLLVGGMHGGWEGNTVTLINQLITHFDTHPEDVLPGMTITLIPAANPDGLVRGREESGRFNANGVDLNRNWGCEWSADAIWRNQSVDAGAQPFSEPETQYVSEFIMQIQPDTVLFYHSAAGGVFAGNCAGDHGSMLMAEVLGQATGYSYGQPFTAYRVTGTAASWVDGEGIPAADVELLSWTASEFERNLRGVMALQEWLSRR